MNRGFGSLHPAILVIYYIFAFIFIMLYQSILYLTITTILIIILNILLDQGTQLKKWWKPLLIMVGFIFILTPFFNRNGELVLFHIFQLPITIEAMISGTIVALSLICIITLFLTLNVVLTNHKILFLLNKWLPKWAILIMLAIRFVPELRQRLKQIEEVQQFKNASYQTGKLHERMKNGMLQIQYLLTYSLEAAMETADSLDARGYGMGERSMYHRYQMKRLDWLFVCLLTLLTIVEILSTQVDSQIFSYPYFLIIYILPIFIEGKEVVKWHFYRYNN